MSKAIPLVKWAGGKRQIMAELTKHFPDEFVNYHEPFVGGLSVFLELFNTGRLQGKTCYLSDIMIPLMNLYRVVKGQAKELIAELSTDGKYTNDKEQFMKCRQRFNELKQKSLCTSVEVAALFLYLNRTCFNGIYRENSKGAFNVPYGSSKGWHDAAAVERLSQVLNRPDVQLGCASFTDTLDNAQPLDFVYMDPPYHSTFSQYTRDSFTDQHHIQLKELVDNLTDKGCFVAISNSDTTFIRQLYAEYDIVEISVKRVINCKAEKRKTPVTELLIRNYRI